MSEDGPARRADRLTTVRTIPVAVTDRVATALAGPVSHGVGHRDTTTYGRLAGLIATRRALAAAKSAIRASRRSRAWLLAMTPP